VYKRQGENWEQFVDYCVAQGLGGLENLALIPGNVGGSPIQNIGAYGVELKDSFYSLEALNIETGAIEIFDKNACEFGYRTSVFKTSAKGRYIILSVTFRLSKNAKTDITYGAIAAELTKVGIDHPGIADVANAVSNIRRSKLPDPKEIGNAGSFFKNPTITAFEYYRIADEHRSLVAYNLNNGYFKLAAGWLIEQCGWKAYRKGDAGVHAHQALILVNYGNATGQEILNLSNEIIASVENKFGVKLEPEVNIL
jgi:UDP-N-acetylmuramate dehydrogenase